MEKSKNYASFSRAAASVPHEVFTPETIRAVFDASVGIIKHPFLAFLLIIWRDNLN